MNSDPMAYGLVILQLGAPQSYYTLIALLIGRTAFLVTICCFLGWLGVKVLDALTHVHEQHRVGESTVATAWLIAGFFILFGLAIHGGITAPGVLGVPAMGFLLDFRRLGLIGGSFIASLFLLVVTFLVLDRVTPSGHFAKVNDDPQAIGIYVFGYLVSLGLLIHAAMEAPL